MSSGRWRRARRSSTRTTGRESNPRSRAPGGDEEKSPLAAHGRPGSLLDIALANNIHLEHNCGGACACTTCHVIVREGEGNLSPMEADEEDRLGTAEGPTLPS